MRGLDYDIPPVTAKVAHWKVVRCAVYLYTPRAVLILSVAPGLQCKPPMPWIQGRSQFYSVFEVRSRVDLFLENRN